MTACQLSRLCRRACNMVGFAPRHFNVCSVIEGVSAIDCRRAIPELVYTQVDFLPACSGFNSMQTASALSLRRRGMTMLMITQSPFHSACNRPRDSAPELG